MSLLHVDEKNSVKLKSLDQVKWMLMLATDTLNAHRLTANRIVLFTWSLGLYNTNCELEFIYVIISFVQFY